MTIVVNVILLILLMFYLIKRLQKSLQIFQQSGYDLKRINTFFKESKQIVIPIHDLIIVGSLLVTMILHIVFKSQVVAIIGEIITIMVLLINIEFIRIGNKYHYQKKALQYTNRIKRIIFVVFLESIIILLFFQLFRNPIFFFLLLSLISLAIYFLIYSAIYILEPYEQKVRLKFQKTAMDNIESRDDLLVIGITGSYGKTSIKNIIYDVISNDYRTLMTPESYNTPNGLTITVNNYLNKLHQVFIAEMGAYYPGEIEELSKLVHPKIGIVSSVGPQHLETFGSIESVQKTKMELIENLPHNGLGILNYDNKYIKDYQIINPVKIKTYSLSDPNCDVFIDNIDYRNDGMIFDVTLNQNTKYSFQTKLLGKHNLYNIAASILVAEYLKIDFDKIDDQIFRIKPIKHRLELKKISEELIIIDDAFNGNYEGMLEGINIIDKFNEYERIMITPGIIDLGEEQFSINEKLSQQITNKLDYLYVIGKTNKEALISGMKDNEACKVKEFVNFIDAYNDAITIEKPKVILIANDLPDKFN